MWELQLISAINELSRKVDKLAEMIKDPYTMEAKSKGAEITLTVNQPATFIDFEYSPNNRNVPAGQENRIYYPSKKIAQLILVNEGQADIRFDINVDQNENFGYAILKNGRIRNIELLTNKIGNIVCYAVQGDDFPAATTAKLRLEYLF